MNPALRVPNHRFGLRFLFPCWLEVTLQCLFACDVVAQGSTMM